ncbi:hypothetical protein [Gephyromycinifex aptenodytis]|uniref:hypothetical protein n=1 Tax=Gephyromycinifex aptenodytis TaxID=2716227 RepID=UPI001D01A35E|nr:hypothetical protein [Gephyromycinifex aptenodytis]
MSSPLPGPRVTPERAEPDAPRRTGATAGRTHWLLPIDPGAHLEHQPPDWRVRPDAGPIWAAIARSQPVQRWCLSTGYRTMQRGDLIWAYLSRRQEICAVGAVRQVCCEDGSWYVLVDWDAERTSRLCDAPLPRSRFHQIPMSVCRAGQLAAAVLTDYWESAAG